MKVYLKDRRKSSGNRGSYRFSTWMKSSSTGVERPKTVTMTLMVERSSWISSTSPSKFAKGPSMMRTFSPFSKWYLGLGFLLGLFRVVHDLADFLVRQGRGPFLLAPTKLVTLGVLRTRCQSASAISTEPPGLRSTWICTSR